MAEHSRASTADPVLAPIREALALAERRIDERQAERANAIQQIVEQFGRVMARRQQVGGGSFFAAFAAAIVAVWSYGSEVVDQVRNTATVTAQLQEAIEAQQEISRTQQAGIDALFRVVCADARLDPAARALACGRVVHTDPAVTPDGVTHASGRP